MTRRLFGSLLGLVFLVNFGRVGFAPLLPELQTAFGVGPAAVGVVASLVWVGTGVVRLPVGYLLTRVARHRVVVATGVVLALASGFTAVADSIRLLQSGALLVGLASGAYFATAVPLISDLYPQGVGRAVGIHGTSAQLAAVVAPTAVVVVLQVATWRAVFWLLAAGSLLMTGVLYYAARREGVPSGAAADRNFRAALAHWRIIGSGMLMIATAGFVWQGLFNFYVSYLTAAKSLDVATASTLLTLTFAAGVPAFWFGGRLADRLPHVPYIIGLLCVFTAGVLAITVVGGVVALAAVSVLLGLVIHALFPALDTYVLGALPADVRGSTYAVFSGLSILLEATGSSVVGVLTEAGYRFDTVFQLFAGGLVVVVVVLCLLFVAGRLPGTSPTPPAGAVHDD